MRLLVLLAILVGIIYLLFFTTVPLTIDEVFIQSKSMLAKEYAEASFANEGRYGEYMLHIKMKRKGKEEVDFFVDTQKPTYSVHQQVRG